MESSLAGIVNVWLCLAIVLGLFVYRRHGAAHKPMITWLAYWLMLGYPAWLTGCICIRGGYSVRCFLIRQTLNIWSCTAARAMFFVKKQRPHPVRQ
ncbi:TPA: phage holin family protein [Escherichia coli]